MLTKIILTILLGCYLGMPRHATATNADSIAMSQVTEHASSIIIGVAPGAQGEPRDLIMNGIKDLALKLEPGTNLRVVDALTQRQIVSFEVPRARSDRLKYRAISPSISKIKEYLNDPRAVRAGSGNSIHLPAFLDYIAASVGNSGRGETRVVLYGSLLFSDPREPAASFEVGCVPSDAHASTESRRTPFGSADKGGSLAGINFDICTLGEQFGSVDQNKIVRFWTLVLNLRGASLTTVAPYPDLINERVLSNANDSVMTAEADPALIALEILCGEIEKPIDHDDTEHNESFDDSEVIPLTATTRTVAVSINIDGSRSMKPHLPYIADLMPKMANLGAKLTRGFRLAIQLFRQPGHRSELPLTPISPSVDGEPSYGMVSLNNFLYDEQTKLDEPGSDKRMVPHFYGQDTLVDVEDGLNRCLNRLKYSGADRPVITLIGDTGPIEMDNTNKISDADRKAIERTLDAVGKFVAEHPDTRIIAIFVGGANRDDEPGRVSEQFFKDLAALAGSRGHYNTDLDDLELLLTKAILID